MPELTLNNKETMIEGSGGYSTWVGLDMARGPDIHAECTFDPRTGHTTVLECHSSEGTGGVKSSIEQALETVREVNLL